MTQHNIFQSALRAAGTSLSSDMVYIQVLQDEMAFVFISNIPEFQLFGIVESPVMQIFLSF